MSEPIVKLDGSIGEGGGQILRTSLALSLITGKPFHLKNIRAGRAKPGLQAQHAQSVRAAAAIGQAKVQGASLGSTDLVFEPGNVVSGKFQFTIGTAGATGLVLHTIYLPLALKTSQPTEITITGGTHVIASPCFHFLNTTWRVYMERLGLRISLKMPRPGFYPRGGGILVANIQPCPELRCTSLLQPVRPTTANVLSAAAGLPAEIVKRQTRRAVARLREAGLIVDVSEERWQGGPGTILAITLNTQPVPSLFFGLGARGKPAERVADEAADQALTFLQVAPGSIDAHSADQIVLPLALMQGRIAFQVAEVTSHLLTNIAIVQRFVERKIECVGHQGQAGEFRVG